MQYVKWGPSTGHVAARLLVPNCMDVRDWGLLSAEVSLLSQVGPPVVLLDLRMLEDSDGGFRGVLVKLWKALRERGGWLRLTNVRPCVRGQLSVSGLDTVFEITGAGTETR
jgi:anti-anti-sigma regulatory factor